MKRLLFAALAVGVLSCNNGGNTDTQGNGDSLSVISPDTGFDGSDTTGLNVRAAQPPVDSADTLREPMENEPGAQRSSVRDDVGGGQ
jgi:hypothetical protein